MFRNAIANWGAFLYVAIISFFLSPIVVGTLGGNAYGVWSMLVAVVGYLGLLDFGVRGAVTRYIAHHHAVSDIKSSSLIATAALSLFGLLGVAAIILSVGLAWAAPLLFHIPGDFMAEAQVVLVLGGATVAVTLISSVYGGIVTGLERFDISSGLEIFITTIRSAAVLIALKTGYGLVALGWIHLLSSVLHGAIMWLTVRRIFPALRLQFREKLMPHVKTIMSFSAYLSIIHVLAVVIFYTDTLVIATMLPISAVGIYAIAGNLTEYARKVAGVLSKMFTPRISAMNAAGSTQIGEAVLNGGRAATLVILPIVITFFLRGESFISLWMGPEYGVSSGAVLKVFSWVIWAGSARSVAASAIIGMNMHRRLIPILTFEAACNLVLSILLVRPLGVTGVAIGTLIPGLFVSLVLIPRCLNSIIGVSPTEYFVRTLIRPTVSAVPFGVATFYIEHYFPAHGMALFFLQVMLIIPLALIGAFFICLDQAERKHVFGLITERVLPDRWREKGTAAYRR